MNRIRQKLHSQAGASITFGLLLFLVCAVLCSVIIVAATTSAGRMAGIAEADQRYYSVTSASELLKELMNGKTVSVVKVTTSWSTTTYTDGVAGTPEQNKDGTGSKNPDVKEYIVTDKNAAQILSAVDTFLVDSNQISGNGAMGTSLPITSILNPHARTWHHHK